MEKCNWSDLVYVGDDPSKDFINLNKLSVKTVRVCSGLHACVKAKKGYDARYRIGNIGDFSTKIFNLHEKK
jgi:putative hydrolase of the HAD superfamily